MNFRLLSISVSIFISQGTNDNHIEALEFLRDFDREASEMCTRVASSEWRYATNSTDYNKRRMREQQNLAIKFECLSWKRAATFNAFNMVDVNVERQLHRIVRQGRCALGDEKNHEIQQLIVQMKDHYNAVKICPYRGDDSGEPAIPILSQQIVNEAMSGNYVSTYAGYCDLRLEPDLIRIMERSRFEPELKHTWLEWREKTGPPMRNSFMRYIHLANQAAQLNGTNLG